MAELYSALAVCVVWCYHQAQYTKYFDVVDWITHSGNILNAGWVIVTGKSCTLSVILDPRQHIKINVSVAITNLRSHNSFVTFVYNFEVHKRLK